MDRWLWLEVFSVLVGAALAIYGAGVLLTGRSLRGHDYEFGRPRDVGVIFLCLGLGFVLLALKRWLLIPGLILAVLFLGFAVGHMVWRRR